MHAGQEPRALKLRMEPHRRLVQDVDEIDEVAVELPGHLHPLALAAGQRRHAAVERQVADADVDEVPERPAHPADQRRDDVADRLVVVPRDELLEHAVKLRQLAFDQPADGPAARELHRARRGVEPNPAAIGARPLGEQSPIRLLAGARDPVLVLVDEQPLELARDAFEGPLVRRTLVDLLDPHVIRPQQALPLGRREPAQRLAGRDDPGLDDLAPVPLPDIVGGMADGALLDAPVEVEQLVDVDRDALAEALAGGAHAVGMVEREAVRPAGERPSAAREEHPQVGVDLGDRADGAAAASSQALLVDHDAGRDVPDGLDRRPGELRQPAAGVGAERLDELALRLGADRVEHERRLAAAAHAGEGDEPMLRNVDVDALEVVRARASDFDGSHLRLS